MVELKKFLKYCTTGLVNSTATYISYALLIVVGSPIVIALGVGYLTGMVFSYMLNTRWTFEKTDFTTEYLIKFIAYNLLLLVVSELTLHFISEYFTASRYLAQGINMIPITVLGFIVNRMLVFKS